MTSRFVTLATRSLRTTILTHKHKTLKPTQEPKQSSWTFYKKTSHALTPNTNTAQCKKKNNASVLMWLTASHRFWNSNGHPMKYRSGQLGCWILMSDSKNKTILYKEQQWFSKHLKNKSSSVLIQSVELFYLSLFCFFATQEIFSQHRKTQRRLSAFPYYCLLWAADSGTSVPGVIWSLRHFITVLV